MTANTRSLASYLTLPRPAEARVKGWLPAIAYGLAHLADTRSAGAPVWAALVAWAVFELGFYQARYALNDIADADLDRSHPAASARARLPDGAGARRRAAVAAAVRVVAAIAAVVLLPSPAREITAGAALGLTGAALGYEAARTAIRRRPAGWRPRPRPWRPSGRPSARLPAPEIGVFALIGGGYAARVGLGVGLAGAGGGLLVAATVYGWAFGTMVVVMTWTIEAAGLRAAGATGVLRRKAHVAALAGLLDESDPGDRPLSSGRPAWLGAGLQAVAMLFALLVAAQLDGAPGPAQAVVLAAVCVVACPVAMAAWPSPAAGWLAVAVNAATCVLATGTAAVGTVGVVVATSTAAAAFRVFTPARLLGLESDAGPDRTPGPQRPSAVRTSGS
jgi:hypothetical protein